MNNISIGFFGLPNSGKSSLINKLTGNNVCIVSHLPQTTQEVIDTWFTNKNLKFCLLDTPGINPSNKGMRGPINKIALDAIDLVDYHFILIDPKKPLVPKIENFDYSKSFFVITKEETVSMEEKIRLVQLLNSKYQPQAFLFTSVYREDRIAQLLDFILSLPPVSTEQIFVEPTNKKTNCENTEIADLKTREQLFRILSEEVPYNVKVVTTRFEEKPKSIIIEQKLLVPKASFRQIILGNLRIKTIRENSSLSLERLFEKKVHLYITVELHKN